MASFLESLIEHERVFLSLRSQTDTLECAARLFGRVIAAGGRVLLCGNGGSAADCQHIAAELVGRFVRERRALPAIALTTDSSILTAVGNDYGFEEVFARQVAALGREGDLLVAISTSGNSENVLRAVRTARALGMHTLALSGRDGGKLGELAELQIVIPSETTARIQEAHIFIGHALCEAVDDHLAREAAP